MAMTRFARVTAAAVIATTALLLPTNAVSADEPTFAMATCTLDPATGVLVVEPERIGGQEAFSALGEAWDGSFTCGASNGPTVQLANVSRIVVRPRTARAYVTVPAWLSRRVGHEIDVDIEPFAPLAGQRVTVVVTHDAMVDDVATPGRRFSTTVGTRSVDADTDGDAEVTVLGALQWNVQVAAYSSSGTVDMTRFRAPRGDTPWVLLSTGRNIVRGPAIGRMNVTTGDGPDTITTGAGPDHVTSGGGKDVIRTKGGNDFIEAGNGDDVIDSGRGNDQVNAGNDDDTIDAGAGDDYVFPDETEWIGSGKIWGDDHVKLGPGRNMSVSTHGNDTILGGPNTDIVRAGGKKLNIDTGAGSDMVQVGFFEAGSRISCGAGADFRRYYVGLGKPPAASCERYVRRDRLKMTWLPTRFSIVWV
ncbi:MAG: hypothetical protein JWO69_370 [Thermoleophilia bacterium]|jgi:Ca2+-binding RTX toxin-like protein|nr:hypothetical protein [Thermoleophilia bacterium]